MKRNNYSLCTHKYLLGITSDDQIQKIFSHKHNTFRREVYKCPQTS